ncbi:hypothetical protein [Sphingobium sp. TCM1]|uniref:hypothetical protein n=1 Tax=Sphingobium sp. TCM1 TaxID=453246 RepID=UPI0007F3FB50|nr:hypothetical protein [Sphingobium sp. TCM1]OAN51863.1 hypothetical protein A7Q26_09220 [Sphingobium sp. TCM1]
MSLYVRSLRELRDRLLDRRRLRLNEKEQIKDLLEVEDLIEVARLTSIYEHEFIDRIDAEGLEAPPQSLALKQYGGDVMCNMREFHSYTRKANKWQQALDGVVARLAELRGQFENPPSALKAYMALQGDIDELEQKELGLRERVDWAKTMAQAQFSGLERTFEKKMTDDDRRYLEPPRFPVKTYDDIPKTLDHVSYVYFPDEPSPYRRALIEVLDRLIATT